MDKNIGIKRRLKKYFFRDDNRDWLEFLNDQKL